VSARRILHPTRISQANADGMKAQRAHGKDVVNPPIAIARRTGVSYHKAIVQRTLWADDEKMWKALSA
jgi:hypothetical protein